MSDVLLWPEGIALLLLAPLVWLLLRRLDRRRGERLAVELGPRARALAPEPSPRRSALRRALFACGLLCALAAVLQPAWGASSRHAEQRGVDVVVCLDVSRSMLARDAAPSRLEAAKRAVAAFADRARGDRLALVAFAGEARLLVPLTSDVDTFAELAAAADPLSVRRGGTDLGAALDAGLLALGDATGGHETIVLVTDGEDLGGRGLRAAEACRARGVAVHCVGYGSARGSKIAVAQGASEAFVRDRSGAEVVSALDAPGLRRIADATGGAFVDAGAARDPLVQLHEQRVVPMARKALGQGSGSGREPRFQWPLAAAFLCWLLDLGLAERRRR